MTDLPHPQQNQDIPPREPAILLPLVITILLGVLFVVQLVQAFVLNGAAAETLIVWFAFIPVRVLDESSLPGGLLPLVWTPFTHALLHAGWEHFLLNAAWLAIFGTPVARRYGVGPTLILFFGGAAVGALAFAVTTLPEVAVLVGASGGIAALTGAACRFIFQPVLFTTHPDTGERIALGRRMATLDELSRDRRARFFIIIWVVLNAAVPFLPLLFGQTIGIAWQAHLGGFLAGLFVTPLFERHPS
ncbi:rhomboid family intramembrane serine protease [Devosia sp.]|uniref:rhomboid family intramembrane serine protease n=1 Tax=Devosia sp. TaxID=1871048 RepID=UPI003A8C92F5